MSIRYSERTWPAGMDHAVGYLAHFHTCLDRVTHRHVVYVDRNTKLEVYVRFPT